MPENLPKRNLQKLGPMAPKLCSLARMYSVRTLTISYHLVFCSRKIQNTGMFFSFSFAAIWELLPHRHQSPTHLRHLCPHHWCKLFPARCHWGSDMLIWMKSSYPLYSCGIMLSTESDSRVINCSTPNMSLHSNVWILLHYSECLMFSTHVCVTPVTQILVLK